MAEDTKVRDNIGDQHDDGLWPDFELSAQSSVHENLPDQFSQEDTLYPDYDQSVESVKDGADVLAEHGFGKDELYPDEDLAQETAKATAEELEEAEAARTRGSDPEGDGDATKAAKKAAPAKKAAAKKAPAKTD